MFVFALSTRGADGVFLVGVTGLRLFSLELYGHESRWMSQWSRSGFTASGLRDDELTSGFSAGI